MIKQIPYILLISCTLCLSFPCIVTATASKGIKDDSRTTSMTVKESWGYGGNFEELEHFTNIALLSFYTSSDHSKLFLNHLQKDKPLSAPANNFTYRKALDYPVAKTLLASADAGVVFYSKSNNAINYTKFIKNTRTRKLGLSSKSIKASEKLENSRFHGKSVHYVMQQSQGPTLYAPDSGASGQPTNLTLKWKSYSGAGSYQLQVSTDENFSSYVINQSGINDTTYQVSGLSKNTTFYWRVRASSLLSTSPWSDIWSFTTVKPIPSAPKLSSPSNNAQDQSTSLKLQWNTSEYAETYRVQLSTDQNFNSTTVDTSGLTATTYSVSNLQNNTTYYWRASAKNNGGTSDWSVLWNFSTVNNTPEIPTLASPSDSSQDQPTDLTFKWNSSTNASTYHLQVSTDQNFGSLSIDTSGLTTTNFSASGFQYSTTYYWRVEAQNNGTTSGWSNSWNFTTTAKQLASPQLQSPSDGTTNLTISPDLNWSAVTNANTYSLQIATDKTFNNKIIQLGGVTSTHYSADSLQYNTTYFWKVRSKNDNKTSSWSEIWSFTTEQGPYVHLQNPSGGEIWKAGDEHTIKWNKNKVSEINLYYSSDDGQSWTTIKKNISAGAGSFTWTIPELNTSQGVIKIQASSDNKIFAESKPFIFHKKHITLQPTIDFGNASDQSNYKMIGLPGDIDIPLNKIIDGKAGKDWKAYYDTGDSTNYLMKFDDSQKFHLTPGNGFWIISKSNIKWSKEVSSNAINSEKNYKVDLHKGWNIISDPFEIAVTWKTIQVTNNINGPLWSFNGNYSKANILKPYRGFYYYNKEGRDQLKIPFQTSKSAASQKRKLTQRRQPGVIKLIVSSRNNQKSEIEIGLSHGKKSQLNSVEYAPPGNFQKLRLLIHNDTQSSGFPWLYKKFISVSDNLNELQLRLKSSLEKPVTFKLKNEEATQRQIYLVDPVTAEFIDLRQRSSYTLQPHTQQKDYKLLIGDKSSIEQRKSDILPQKITLAQNYPNPFNGQTVIAYTIPKKNAHQKVTLILYNILGQKVKTLIRNASPKTGRHIVRWNGTNNQGEPVTSGVYIYRLLIGGKSKSHKMTYLK